MALATLLYQYTEFCYIKFQYEDLEKQEEKQKTTTSNKTV